MVVLSSTDPAPTTWRRSDFFFGVLIGVAATVLVGFFFGSDVSGSTTATPQPASTVDVHNAIGRNVSLQATGDDSTPPPSPRATARPSSESGTTCEWKFVAYHPSPLEKEWWTNIDEYKKDSCNVTMTKYKDILYQGVIDHYPSFVPNRLKTRDEAIAHDCDTNAKKMPDLDALRKDDRVYSWFEYRNTCTKVEYRSPIEPLAGPLRHPRLCAPGWSDPDVIRHDWLVVDPWVVRQSVARDPSMHKRRFFDVGSSVWKGDAVMGSSQHWFWSVFARWCMPFQSVHAWEKAVFPPQKALGMVPAFVKPFYHWFNVAANPSPGHGDNPLHHIANVASADDYVLMKLDVDHTPTEEALVDLLMANRTLLSLIDEFFWEHHVIFPNMQRAWGLEPGMKDQGATIKILAEMRREGVRAHSWV